MSVDEGDFKESSDPLEEDDIDQLTEDQPRVEFLRHVIPPIPFIPQLGLQFLLPPGRPPLIDGALILVLVQPSERLQLSDDPFLLALFPQDVAESCIIGRPPKGEIEQEEGSGDESGEVPEDDELQAEGEERELGQLGGEDGVRQGVYEGVRGGDLEDCAGLGFSCDRGHLRRCRLTGTLGSPPIHHTRTVRRDRGRALAGIFGMFLFLFLIEFGGRASRNVVPGRPSVTELASLHRRERLLASISKNTGLSSLCLNRY